MAYTPNNWKDGDVITAEKMNKLEQGIVKVGNDVDNLTPLVGHLVYDDSSSNICRIDLTFKDIYDAVFAGRNIYILLMDSDDYETYQDFYYELYSIAGYSISHYDENTITYIVTIYNANGATISLYSTSETGQLTSEQPSYS